MGIGNHESAHAQTVEWLTPPDIVRALGEFDLDPCAPVKRPWDTAKCHYALPTHNGLALPWFGRVWLNPPYGRLTGRWLQKLVHHGNGVALIFARTETAMFFEYVWYSADAIFFLRGRPTFYKPDGTPGHSNCGAPVCLVAYGRNNVDLLRAANLEGYLVILKQPEDGREGQS